MIKNNILAIDTCTEVCSVSLYTQGEIISRFVKNVVKSSSLILPLCDEVLLQADLPLADLDVIAYSKGPGAFTGVRMCVSVVQGMSLAHSIPTMGFSTLELLAIGAAKKYSSNKIAVALDARMDEVYWGVYEDNILKHECLSKPSEVDILDDTFIGVGTGWGVYQDMLLKHTGIRQYVADFYPQAQNLIDLYLSQSSNYDKQLPLPSYLRNNVAQKSLK